MQKKKQNKNTSGDFFFCSGNHATPLIFLHEITPTGRPIIIINFASSDKNKKKLRVRTRHNLIFSLFVLFIYFVCGGQHFQGLAAIYRQIQTFFKKPKKQKNKTKQNEKTKFFLTEFSVITVNVINI